MNENEVTIENFAALVGEVDTLRTNTETSLTNITTELEATKKSVADGKSLVASAISNKGVTTATDASFQVMADNLNKLYSKNEYDIAYDNGKAKPKTGTVSIAVQRRPENNYVRIYVNGAEYNIDCGSAGAIKSLSFSYTIN